MLARMPGGEDHGKKGPTLPHLPCQINSVHGTGKPDVCKDHGNVSPADQHDCKRSFRAFALDGVDRFVFEQCCREATEISVVLDNQYDSMFLLRLAHCRVPPSWHSS